MSWVDGLSDLANKLFAPAVAADDHELGRLGLLDNRSRLVPHDHPANRDVRIALLKASQALGQDFLRLVFRARPLRARRRPLVRVTPRSALSARIRTLHLQPGFRSNTERRPLQTPATVTT